VRRGVVAALAALAVILRPQRYTALFSFLVAAGGLAAVLVYRYLDVGVLRPLPDRYEPVRYARKTQSAWSEGVAAIAAAALLVAQHARRRAERPSGPDR
jgi:hypothetical protein